MTTFPPRPVLLLVTPSPGADRQTAESLAELGFDVVVAHDGDQALTRFVEESARIVLIAADMAPDAAYAGSYDICEKLQALPGAVRTPIVVLNRSRDVEATARARRAGATDIVDEPIDAPALAHRLHHFVAAAHAFCDAEESGRRLEASARLAHLAQWELDLATGQLRWTTDPSPVFGFPMSEEPGVAALTRWVHPHDLDRVSSALSTPAAHDIEFRVVSPGRGELGVHQKAAVELDDLDGTIRLVGVAQDVTELRRAERQVHALAYFDSLTGLPNRVFLRRFLGHTLAAAARDGHHLAVLALDLDLFKRVNDTLGHTTGDALLEEVARRIESSIRSSDTATRPLRTIAPEDVGSSVASRLGGDEFVVVLSRLSRAEDAALVAGRINRRLAEGYDLMGQRVFISSSIGIAMYPENGADADALLAQADAAMYDAKHNGRNTYRFYSAEIQETVRRRVDLDTRLRAALASTIAGASDAEVGKLLLHYQPKLRLPDRELSGVEALLRWSLPGGTMISPAEFIPIAEDTGFIVELGRWVLGAACRQAAAWRAEGRPLAVAVNVSARQLREPGFVASVAAVLAATGLPAALLEIEITEATAMADQSAGDRALGELKQLGVQIALDDFGTGYSSLSWLSRLPIDTLKIDRTFVQSLGCGDRNDVITLTIVQLAARLGLRVVAEGVETLAQLRQLAALGPMEVQGYLFARPMSDSALAAWREKHDSMHAASIVHLTSGVA
jgi:predicted signal transduction protein with EAL and GGDEF domain/DNA-binding response OmpR family regulator